LLLLALYSACRRDTPEVLYAEAQSAQRSGDLKRALELARRGFDRDPASWRFRVLKAEILLDAGAVRPALSLVHTKDLPPSAELRARRLAPGSVQRQGSPCAG
jgi:hypothetical protein